MYYSFSMIDGYIYGIASSDLPFSNNINEEEANAVKLLLCSKPTAPDGYTYKLRASDLEWELVELPPMPEPELTPEEALSILLGGDGE